MKFRKKPVVIEAVQWTIKGHEALINNFDEINAFAPGKVRLDTFSGLFVKTLEGELHASTGDWIIKGIKGEFYPCKPDIFEMTYERVDLKDPS